MLNIWDTEKITVIWDVELCDLVEMYWSYTELVVNVFQSTYIPDSGILFNHLCENQKFYIHFSICNFQMEHCATSWKVAELIPDGVIGIFHWHSPSSRTMALELTQPLTEMSTRNISWGVKAASG